MECSTESVEHDCLCGKLRNFFDIAAETSQCNMRILKNKSRLFDFSLRVGATQVCVLVCSIVPEPFKRNRSAVTVTHGRALSPDTQLPKVRANGMKAPL